MCEMCGNIGRCHPRCPNATEPIIKGYCEQCKDELREDYEYYTDNENHKFCSEDCALEYHGVESKEWEYEEE